MKLPPSVADPQRHHVVLELECLDRLYLNAYVPQLTREGGVASFFRVIPATALPPPSNPAP